MPGLCRGRVVIITGAGRGLARARAAPNPSLFGTVLPEKTVLPKKTLLPENTVLPENTGDDSAPEA